MRARRIVLLAGLIALLGAASPPPALMGWGDLYARPKPTAARERIAYGTDPLQHGELWLPAAGVARRAPVLLIHGGCWQSDVADLHIMDWAAADLAARGHPVWNVEYRGVDRAGGGYPGTFLDVAAAAAAWPRVARSHRLPPVPPVAVGHSAGGHLALWLAGRGPIAAGPLRGAAPRLAGVVSLGGLPDLPAARDLPGNDCGAGGVPRLVGAGHGDAFADTSVPRLLPLNVRQWLIHGARDRIAPPSLARDYAAKARAAGDKVELVEVPAQGHVEEIAPGTPAWTAAVRAIEALGARRR